MDPARPPSPDRAILQYIDYLALADPQAAQRMRGHLSNSGPSMLIDCLPRAVDEVIDALAVEISFGRALADGLGRLLASGTRDNLDKYRHLVGEAAVRGPTLATLFARHLVTVLISDDTLLADRFEATTRIMLQKGTYTLKAPLEALTALIEENDLACAHAFLDLLASTYALAISYNRTVYLTHTLPRVVNGLGPRRRLWQIRGLTRVLGEDERLADDYLQGLAAGLHLLSAAALNEFIDQAIRRYRKNHDLGRRFLALESRRAADMCRDLQVAVPLSAVRSGLERYLQARTGLAVAVRPFSSLSADQAGQGPGAPLVRCDGRAIYLPDEMDLLERQADNAALYKLLGRLEAGTIEFGTYDLDVEKALDKVACPASHDVTGSVTAESDLSRFLIGFEHPTLALDLFTLCEHARIAHKVRRRYPGLSQRLGEALVDRHLLAATGYTTGGTLYPLYRHLVLNEPQPPDTIRKGLNQALGDRLNRIAVSDSATVEASARLVLQFYPMVAEHTATNGLSAYRPLALPFGRRSDPACFAPFHTTYDRLAADIHKYLAERRIRAYRSDLRHILIRQNGQISVSDIRNLIVKPSSTPVSGVDLSELNLEALICSHGLGQPLTDADAADAFRYGEWDWCMGDYLPEHVRVMERKIFGADPGFYRRTLDDFHGLVQCIRYAFELLRPEKITILRQWPEGDGFDYRALLDYILDKKAGLMPSERLFIKRIKKNRDVAALLLVDLSRSTANAVGASGLRVIDVEKQAIVLLCEALQVIGDRFAIAGFSGTGPLGVDYYRIKDLDEPVNNTVKGRISAMAPQRSTRMGAAIRHAAARLAQVQAKVRLIIILGDGFPNDLAYKGPYAVEDTRQAVIEARAAAIYVKAITVNVSDNGQLDRLYGAAHHTLIGNVADLPDKLVRVYSALTRH